MPSLLSGSSLRSGGSGQYLPLTNAQPQLLANADTSTGYTIVTNSLLVTSYRSSLGNLEMNSGTVYNNIQDTPIVFVGTGTSNVQIRGNAVNTSTNTGALVVQGGIGIRDGLWTGQDIHVNGLTVGQGYQGINNIVLNGTSIQNGAGIGQSSISVGYDTLKGLNSALRSIAIGQYALSSGTNIIDSLAIGVGALRNAGTNNTPIASTITGVTIIPSTSITGATNTTPVLITAIGHGLSSGTQILITGVNGLSTYSGGPSLINNTVFWISRQSADTFTLYKNKTLVTPMNGVTSNGYTLTGYSSSGTVFNPVVINSPGYNLIGGTLVLITDVNGTTQLNNHSYYINPLTTSTFALYNDSITNSPVDGSLFTSYISSGSVRTYNVNGSNIGIGTNAGAKLINGEKNFFMGYNVAKNFTTGSSNFFVGHEVASNMTYGSGIFAFGGDNLVNGVDNQINIGSVFYYDGGGYLQLNADTGLGLGTSSTSTDTGAFNVYGGAGISDNLYVGTTLHVAGTGTFVTDVQVSRNLNVSKQLTVVGNGDVRLSPVSANVYIQPSAGGSVTITSNAAGSMDSIVIGGNDPKDGHFDNLYSNNLRVINTITGSIYTATNIKGGAVGSIPYQYSTGTTLFIPIGVPDTILVSNGTTATWKTLASAIGTTGTNAGTLFINTVSSSTVYYLGLDVVINDFSKVSSDPSLNYNTGNSTLYTPRISVSNTSTVGGAAIITTATIGNYLLAVATATTIIAGTDTAVNTSTGNITIWNTSTLQSITNRGSTTTNAINIANTTSASSTNSGALIVAGGVGIGKNLYVGGTIYSGRQPVLTTASFVNSVISGPGISISADPNGVLTFSNTATLQSVTNNGSTTTSIVTFSNTATSTSTTTGAVIITGGLGVGGRINSESLQIADAIFDSSKILISTTATTVIDSYSVSDYRTAKYLIQVDEGSGISAKFESFELILLVNNNQQVYATEYGVVRSSTPLGGFAADVQGDNIVRLYYTAVAATAKELKVLRTALTVQ